MARTRRPRRPRRRHAAARDGSGRRRQGGQRSLMRGRPIVHRAVRKLLGRSDQEPRTSPSRSWSSWFAPSIAYRGDCSFDASIGTLAARVVFKAVRHRRVERRVLYDTWPPPDFVGSDQPAYRAMLRSTIDRVRRHIDDIDHDRGWAFLLHDVHGYDVREMAAIMGTSVAAAQSRLVRGRKDLHERLAADPELAGRAGAVGGSNDEVRGRGGDAIRGPSGPGAGDGGRGAGGGEWRPSAEDVAAIERALRARSRTRCALADRGRDGRSGGGRRGLWAQSRGGGRHGGARGRCGRGAVDGCSTTRGRASAHPLRRWRSWSRSTGRGPRWTDGQRAAASPWATRSSAGTRIERLRAAGAVTLALATGTRLDPQPAPARGWSSWSDGPEIRIARRRAGRPGREAGGGPTVRRRHAGRRGGGQGYPVRSRRPLRGGVSARRTSTPRHRAGGRGRSSDTPGASCACQPASAGLTAGRRVATRRRAPRASCGAYGRRSAAPASEVAARRAGVDARGAERFVRGRPRGRRPRRRREGLSTGWIELIARHPDGQLTDSARAERRRLLGNDAKGESRKRVRLALPVSILAGERALHLQWSPALRRDPGQRRRFDLLTARAAAVAGQSLACDAVALFCPLTCPASTTCGRDDLRQLVLGEVVRTAVAVS